MQNRHIERPGDILFDGTQARSVAATSGGNPGFRTLSNVCKNRWMARGWESKDVESQVEATQTPQPKPAHGPKTPEQIERDQKRKDLELSRTRVLNDLAAATHPNHRKSLEAALAHLEQKIAELG